MNTFTKDMYRTVARHFVSLSCVQRAPSHSNEIILVFSGFLVDIDGVWFYVTAGHILRRIRAALEAGSVFDVWRLGDQTAGNRFNGIAIPYAFDIEHWLVLEDEDAGLDYAAVVIEGLYRRNLEVGGSIPIGKDAWSDYIAPHDFWALIGIPSETIEYDDKTIIKADVVMTPLTLADEPEGAGRKADNQFYAQISDDSTPFLKDADGLSGGPLFSFRKIDGVWNYWVIGVQSGWYRSPRTLAACPFSAFAFELETVVLEAREQAARGGEQTDAT